MKIIILELNEVPHNVLKQFIGTNIIGKFSSDYHQTYSLDKGHLSPWITWATIHRGVTNETHGIKFINQCTDDIDERYPTIFSECLDKGLKVGLVNTMHSGRLAMKKINKYSFLIPEPFAIANFCIPKSLEKFQEFNLSMSRNSSRIVSKKFPKNINLFNVFISYFTNTRRIRAIKKVITQLLNEIFSPYLKIRRRTIQSDLIFDLFFSLLKKESPDLSVFFTNHVASSMHRFWEASYPYEYNKQISSNEWINKYKNEIPYAMKTAKEYINILKKFVDKKNDTQLWIMSGMGQKKVEDYVPQEYFWDIMDINEYVSSCLNREVKVTQLPQMIPEYSFTSDYETINEFEEFLKKSKNIKLAAKTKITIGFVINNQENLIFTDSGSFIPKGLIKRVIDEKTSSAAYHYPEGFLLRYGPNLHEIKKEFFYNKKFIKTDKIKTLIKQSLNLI